MKIHKHGDTYNKEDSEPKEKFKCEKCGCEFNCELFEYYADLGGGEPYEYGNINLTISTSKSTITDYLVCSCPECHKIVTKPRERKKEYYHETIIGLGEASTI